MNELLTQQLKQSFGEDFRKDDCSNELKNFISQVEASYSDLTRRNVLLDRTLDSFYKELSESNKNVIERNNDLYNLLRRRSEDLALQTEETNKAYNLLSQYREAIDNTLIVTMTDPKGMITYVNDNFCKISGYSLEEAVNHSHNLIRHPSTSPDLYKQLWKAIKNKKIWKSTMRNRKKDGSSYYVSINIIPFYDTDGEINRYVSIQEDITSKVLVQQKLQAEQKRTSIIFNHQENAVIITNKKRNLIKVNQSFYTTFGFKDLEDFQKNHSCICELFLEEEGYLKQNTPERYWAEEVLENPDQLHRALILDQKGETRTFKVNSRYIDLDGEQSILSTFTDISESERLRVKAEEAQQAKSEFLANMSHEIRTPLNGIFGFLQLLDATELDHTQKEYVHIAQNSMGTLIDVINNVLDFSKIESGKIQKNSIETDLHLLLESIYEIFLPVAEHKKIIYTLEIDPGIHASLKIDEQHTRQILQNFINNALKFTPEYGSVALYVDLVSIQNDTQRIRISVKDTGIGIPENKLETIMQPFSQADSSTTRKFGGTGLGLSISKSLIELLGGEMHIVSTEGKGSTFSFELDTTICSLPRKQRYEKKVLDAKPISLMTEPASDPKEDKPFSILIAEDYEVNRMFMGMLLNNYNKITYDFARNGKEAIHMVKTNPYDIILMDINMPVMNGCDATVIIREELKLDIPIIALTANALEGDKEKFINIGMNDYVAKPLEITNIDKLLKKYRHC
ncbi:MAG TPA: ATP-binding protein [Sulfurovum sp.]|uniref:PAS domain-containing hybrid sensor histidine kinase/response regulator n=1 Tax=Sulfurovum sp. TaxID=1969726 RepID=UPI002F93AA58